MTVFAMLELLKSRKLDLVELSAILSVIRKGGKCSRKFDSNLFGMHGSSFHDMYWGI